MKLSRCLATACALLLAACQGAQEETTASPVADVAVQAAATRDFQELLTAYGTVEFSPAHTRSLVVQVDSRVAEVLVTPGANVTKNQPLLRVAPSETTRLDADKALREAEVAAAEAQRQERLRAQGLATNADVESARAAAASAAQLRDSMRARIRGEALLRAPSAGVVDALTAQPGDVITAGTTLLRVADASEARVRVGLEAEDLARVRAGEPVFLSDLKAGAPRLESAVSEVDQRIDPQTRLAAALAPLPAGEVRPSGAAMHASILVGVHRGAVTVPRSAVLFSGEQPYVFVAKDGKAHRQDVQTGLQDETSFEILEGLTAGTPVITRGNYELEEDMPVRIAQAAPAATQR